MIVTPQHPRPCGGKALYLICVPLIHPLFVVIVAATSAAAGSHVYTLLNVVSMYQHEVRPDRENRGVELQTV